MNNMKKYLVISLLLFPLFSSASFSKDLYYGVRGDAEVQALQEFLTEQNLYTGPITGNFFSLTLQAVKALQARESITPTSGYFGSLTRAKVNNILVSQGVFGSTAIINESGTLITTPAIIPPKGNEDIIAKLNEQLQSLVAQLNQLQANQRAIEAQQTILTQQNQSLQNIRQEQQTQTAALQQIKANTTPAPTPPAPLPPAPPSPTVLNLTLDATKFLDQGVFISVNPNHKIILKKIRIAVGDYELSHPFREGQEDAPVFPYVLSSLPYLSYNGEDLNSRSIQNKEYYRTITGNGGYVDFIVPDDWTPGWFSFPLRVNFGGSRTNALNNIAIYSWTMTLKADGTEIIDEFGRPVPLPQDYSVHIEDYAGVYRNK